MAGNRKQRAERKSTARRRAKQKTSGFSGTVLKVPQHVGFWECKVGTHVIDIIPFIAKEGNPYADPGELHYERTFFIYRNIGPNNPKSYVAPGKTFNAPDYIQEWRADKAEDPNADEEMLKKLAPKERQIFLFRDHKDPDKLQLFESSYHTFGKLLDSRIDNAEDALGWDTFYFPEGGEGMSLRLTVEETDGGGFTFKEITAIDFVPRKDDLPQELLDAAPCLDDCLVHTDYDTLKAIFLGEEGHAAPRQDDDDAPAEPKKDRPDKDKPKQEQKKDKPDPAPAKDEASDDDTGWAPGDSCIYEGAEYTIFKMSPQKTKCILEPAGGGDQVKGVKTSDLKPMVAKDDPADDDWGEGEDDDDWGEEDNAKPAEEEVPFEPESEPAAAKESGSDDAWDDDDDEW